MKKLKTLVSALSLVALCGCGTTGSLSHNTVNTAAAIGTAVIGFAQNTANLIIDKTTTTTTNAVEFVENVITK